MFDGDRPDAYELVYEGLVGRLAEADLEAHGRALGLTVGAAGVLVPAFGKDYLVARSGVTAREEGGAAPLAHRIVLAHLLLHGGSGEPAGSFVPFRDLPGGMDFARNLAVTVEGRLARAFTGRATELRSAAEALGGRPADPGTGCDAAFVIPALPVLPLMFTFYDGDEDFPAEAKVLYDAAALDFLDLECLAVLGGMLVEALEGVL